MAELGHEEGKEYPHRLAANAHVYGGIMKDQWGKKGALQA